MMPSNSFFRKVIFLFFFPLLVFGLDVNNKKIPDLVFSEIEISRQEFNNSIYTAQSFSSLIPLAIIKYEVEKFYNNLGYLTKEKKILIHSINNKSEELNLKSFITKKNKKSIIYITDSKKLGSNEATIKNLLLSIKKILMRRYLNDYIKEIESDIKKIDRKQNKLILKNPKYLEMNSTFFYKLFQKNESKKIHLKVSLEKLYQELDESKEVYNKI
jgi:hypothetical protein